MFYATGQEILNFFDNHFPAGYYYEPDDGNLRLVDGRGVWSLSPEKMYNMLDISDLVPNDRNGKPIPFAIAYRKAMEANNARPEESRALSPADVVGQYGY